MEMIVLGSLIFFTLVMTVVGITITKNQNQLKARVNDLQSQVSTPSVLQAKSTQKFDDSFTQRIMIPFAQALSYKVQRLIPTTSKSWIRQKLTQAGYSKVQHVRTFIGVHCISTFGPILFILFLIMVTHSISGLLAFFLLWILGTMGFVMPLLWLIQNAKKRQDSIRKALPDFLDLLVICVEAGLGLDIAISKISKIDSIETSSFLRDELLHYIKDIGFGKPRREALLDLATRTGVDDLNAIVNALIQSYDMGTGVVQTLKVQSEGLRQRRLHRAEAAANKISVKMVLPIYLFFFPGIFIVILGPMILYTIKQISTTMQHTGGP